MPQLDLVIVFPQIFWLFLFFTFFYFLLTYYFLPIFLKTIRSRKEFIKNNQLMEIHLIKEVSNKQQNMFNITNISLGNLRFILFTKLLHIKFKFNHQPFKKNFLVINKKILIALTHSFFFCNSILLNYVKCYPFVLNKKVRN
uniref:ATP synthase F0 subunit 8 n=1 Tax=Gredgaria maugeana TaxID=2007213 RepID=UPI0022FDA413|nr:ATP synthase F0 subunit 8 [Gredgaria maugeana]WAX04220.1 ATP synthase F0 subunit 8 [Gredgaria maugeana]